LTKNTKLRKTRLQPANRTMTGYRLSHRSLGRLSCYDDFCSDFLFHCFSFTATLYQHLLSAIINTTL